MVSRPALAFLPAAYEPLLLFYGQVYPPFVVAIIGALVSAGAEYLNYHMYRAILGKASVERRRHVERSFASGE